MSSLNRILTGSLSGFGKNFFIIFLNIAALPIYLTFWNVETYAIWIIILTINSFLKLPIFAYQEYLGNEFLKLGKKKKIEISQILFGSIIIVIIFFLISLFAIYIILNFTNINNLIKTNNDMLQDIKNAIIILYTSEIIGYSVGIITRALYPFYYYPKLNFIGLIISIIVSVSQILFLTFGFNIIGLSIVTFIVTNCINLFYLIYLFKLIKKEKIKFYKYNIIENLNHCKKSGFLIVGKISEMIKNEGARLILVPFLGSILMLNYVVMRTANNIMKSFFFSFINSFMIEFIDYINEEKKQKFHISYTVLYLLMCLIITTSAFFFQIIAPTLFRFWTKNSIPFDNILFASMTITFLIMVFYYPGVMILKGKNLYKQDFIISIITSLIFIVISIFLIDMFNLRGVGFSLIIIEIISCILIFYTANYWLKENFVQFNTNIISISLVDLIGTTVFIFLYIVLEDNQIHIIIIYLLSKSIIIKFFWSNILSNQKKKVIKIFNSTFKSRK